MTLFKKVKAAIKPLSFSPLELSCDLPKIGQISYTLKRSSKRQTLSLQVRSGKVIVNAPSYLSQTEINAFLTDKSSWLLKVMAKQESLPCSQMQYENGSKFMLFGHWYTLELTVGSHTKLSYDSDTYILQFISTSKNVNNKAYIRRKLQTFIKDLAVELIAPRLQYWANSTGYQPSNLTFKYYKSRWGCCYSNGEVRINPLIIGAPWSVIDCVIVHELCHLQQMNHSAKFWALNEQHCGQCDMSKEWLRQNHNVLQLPPIIS